MLKKIGINTTRQQKQGPNIKDGIPKKAARFKKIVTCACGCKMEKSCENEWVCDITNLLCPKCGEVIS
jgi:hypothetical protein